MRARYWNAGHLLGSASIEMEFAGAGKDGKAAAHARLRRHRARRQAATSPIQKRRPGFDYVISESTYGDGDRPPITRNLAANTLPPKYASAHSRDGALLIPAFAVERTQELIVDLVDLVERGEVPAAPIFLDSPLAIRATEVFRQHAKSLEPAMSTPTGC